MEELFLYCVLSIPFVLVALSGCYALREYGRRKSTVFLSLAVGAPVVPAVEATVGAS